MEYNFHKKRVLITASSKGIGKSIAEAFVKAKAQVAICSSNEENLVKTAVEIKNTYKTDPLWIKCDLSKQEDITRTAELIHEHFGGVDILVNNCGGPKAGNFDTISEDLWDLAHREILLSNVRFTKALLPEMKKNKWGRIINITSISVKQPMENLILSNVYRAGVTAFTKSLSQEVGEFNITVNCVAPGYTLTHRLYELAVDKSKRTGESHEHILANMANQSPLKRLGRPDEIASMVLYLASEQAGFITGNTFTVDGGYTKSLF